MSFVRILFMGQRTTTCRARKKSQQNPTFIWSRSCSKNRLMQRRRCIFLHRKLHRRGEQHCSSCLSKANEVGRFYCNVHGHSQVCPSCKDSNDKHHFVDEIHPLKWIKYCVLLQHMSLSDDRSTAGDFTHDQNVWSDASAQVSQH